MSALSEAMTKIIAIEASIADALHIDALRALQDFTHDYAPTLRATAVKLRQRFDATARLGLALAAEEIENQAQREQMLDLLYDAARALQANTSAPQRVEEEAAALPVVKCDRIGKRFSKTAFALQDVSLNLTAGEILGIVGPNGAGKTTLLRLLTGALAPDTGMLTYPAISERLDWKTIKRAIAQVPQTPERWYGSVRTNLNFVAAAYGQRGDDLSGRIDWVISRYDLGPYQDIPWHHLSGGYKTRFELARAMLSCPRLLVLDEPLAFLDVVARQRFLQDIRAIAKAQGAPTAIILTSQHLHEIETIADRMMLIDGGKAVFSGTMAELAERALDRTLELMIKVPRGDVEILLDTFGLRNIDLATEGYIVTLPRAVDVADVFTAMHVTFGAEFMGLRDVSGSSRRLLSEHRA